MAPSAPLIKGYLPVRLLLPCSWSESYHDETYFYVREHKHNKAEKSENDSDAPTLFVANVPVVPGISTKILLTNLLGRFANVSRVTVVSNPRGSQNGESLSQFQTELPEGGIAPSSSQGKFAHVVFFASKDLKKVWKGLQEVMQPHKRSSQQGRAGLSLDSVEIQTLADETSRQSRAVDAENDDSDDENEAPLHELSGIQAVAQRIRDARASLSRESLWDQCNSIMKGYEDAEEEKRRSQELARSQPDDDGFVTVSYSNVVETEELQASTTPTTVRRKGNKRNRRRKDAVGSQELQDFYRFQRRENKKRTLDELRIQFEEDLQRVKRLKEDNRYKPF
eukprot:Nitzschia sp. Nitz4//scaffold74_size92883//4775//5785//NITZ4_004807-RA/size92883-processed-gene-0.74-mRNA-1//-1//CDS//3329557547//3003//frame0